MQLRRISNLFHFRQPRGRPGQDWLRGGGSIYILGLCFPGCFSIRGPASVRGREQGSLTVQCRYDPKWKNYVKWWCKGAVWSSCQILVKTTESEEVRSGRVSIRDYPANLTFTVTLDSLTEEDEGTYKCGILSPFGHDPMFQVTVSVFPGEPHTLPLYQLRVCELILENVLQTSLMNITTVTFKVIPLGSYASMPVPSPPFKAILELFFWNGPHRCRSTLDVLTVIKMSSFQYFLYLQVKKSHWGPDQMSREGVPIQLFVYWLKSPSQTVPCELVHCRDAKAMNCRQKVQVV
uniref:Ig-like domain-containing protein n=1 Tax=Rhinolophus ferrumequinum TaxID=59479 RepID=A0A671ELN9_RHIFE